MLASAVLLACRTKALPFLLLKFFCRAHKSTCVMFRGLLFSLFSFLFFSFFFFFLFSLSLSLYSFLFSFFFFSFFFFFFFLFSFFFFLFSFFFFFFLFFFFLFFLFFFFSFFLFFFFSFFLFFFFSFFLFFFFLFSFFLFFFFSLFFFFFSFLFFCQCPTCTETPAEQSSNNARPTPRTRVGALSRCHPGHRDTPGGSRQDTHSTPVPERGGCGWPKHKLNATHVVRRSTEPIRLECKHGSGAEGSKCSQDPARTQDSDVKPRRVADARVTLSHTRDDSEKVTDEEMDEMIEIVEVACSITQVRIPERIAEQIAARTCRKEQTVEAMKMTPQERVSNRTVKQITDKPESGNSTDFGAQRG